MRKSRECPGVAELEVVFGHRLVTERQRRQKKPHTRILLRHLRLIPVG